MEPEAWVNAFLGRIFWDFLGEKYWANVVSKKIQMKLSKIRVGIHTNMCTHTPLQYYEWKKKKRFPCDTVCVSDVLVCSYHML